jgi:hypothetical protein
MQFVASKILDLNPAIWNLGMLFSTAVGRAPLRPPRLPSGGVKFTVKDHLLRQVVFCLLSNAKEVHGEKKAYAEFTLTKGSATSTLRKALEYVRDYLPNGLVPEEEDLSDSTLQTLRNEFNSFQE